MSVPRGTRLRPFARFWYDPVYRVNLFAICCWPNAFHANVRRLLKGTVLQSRADEVIGHLGAPLDGCAGRTFRLAIAAQTGGLHPIVVLWIRPGSDVSVVTHEAWHAAWWIFHERGVTFNEGADEPMGYYLQFLVRAALGWHR